MFLFTHNFHQHAQSRSQSLLSRYFVAKIAYSVEVTLFHNISNKENIDSTYESLNGFSKTVEETFEQLQNLKEAAEAK